MKVKDCHNLKEQKEYLTKERFKMRAAAIKIEKLFKATIEETWQEITDVELLWQWFFNISDFKPEVGFEFSFVGGKQQQYIHHCKVLEVVEHQKLVFLLP